MDKFSLQKILNTLPTKYYIIDLISKEILQTNDPKIEPGTAKCHKQLFDYDLPCKLSGSSCICERLIEDNKETEFIIETGEGLNKKTNKCNASFLEENVIIAHYIDIEDQVNYRKELKINYKRLERAEKLAEIGYWEFNIEELIVVASKGAKAIYGVNDDMLHLNQIQDLVLPEFRELLNTELKELINKGKPYNVKFKIARANDGVIRIIHSVAEFRDDKNMVFGVIHDITNRIKSEKALEESLKDLKLAQRFAKIGNWNLNPATGSVNWAEQLFYIFNREHELGFNKFADFEGYLNKENYQELKVLTDAAIKYGTPFDLQLKINLPNKNKWIEFICKPDQNPGLLGHFLRGTIQDITESKEVEIELNNSNKLLRTVIDNIPDAIYMKDKNFRKLLANKGDARNCGIQDVNEIIGKSDYDIYPKEVADIYTEDDRKVIETGKAIENREEVLPSLDGDRWVLTSKFPLKNEDNEIIGLVGIGRDITELKEQRDKLGLLQQTIEQSPLPIVITDREGLIEYVNPGFTKASGYSFKEAIRKNPRILKSGSQDKKYYKNLWDTISSGKNWSGEFHNKRKNGTYYWESAVITPILNSANEIKHFVAIKEDITEKKEMIRDLEIAKEKAEESDHLKTLFLANMSHEIRTPLNGILGFSSIICSGVQDEQKLEEFGKIIEISGQRLTTVIDDIIDISMIQSNQLKLSYETFNINDLLKEMHLIYQNQKMDKMENLEFGVVYCQNGDRTNIFSDKNRVYQVIKNLLDNAFKFTETGFIKFGCSGTTNNEIELFVEDTGIGIDDSKTNLIFESFRQANEGYSRKYDGSGLGLAIISGILEKMGGKIGVETKLNKGSRFYFSIPRNNSKIINEQKSVKPELEVVAKTNNLKRIVSFEDDVASIEYLKIIADMMGYQLVNFDYAKEGIEYLKTHPADLVLMDVQLPEMNGYDATRIIKANHPEIPIIIQTAFAMKGDREKAFQAGCDDYLPKPLSLKGLKEKIEKLVVK